MAAAMTAAASTQQSGGPGGLPGSNPMAGLDPTAFMATMASLAQSAGGFDLSAACAAAAAAAGFPSAALGPGGMTLSSAPPPPPTDFPLNSDQSGVMALTPTPIPPPPPTLPTGLHSTPPPSLNHGSPGVRTSNTSRSPQPFDQKRRRVEKVRDSFPLAYACAVYVAC